MAVVIDFTIVLQEHTEGSPEVPMLLTVDDSFKLLHVVTLGDSIPVLERALETDRLPEGESEYWEDNLVRLTEGPLGMEGASRMNAFVQNYLHFELTGNPYAIQRGAGVKVSVGPRHGRSSPLIFVGHITEVLCAQQINE